jgi:hypothetical protein
MESIDTYKKDIYDNDLSNLYKWSIAKNTPINLIYTRKKIEEDNIAKEDLEDDILVGNGYVFTTLKYTIASMLDLGYSPSEMYKIVRKSITKIVLDDVFFTYYELLYENSVRKDILKEMNTMGKNLTEKATRNYDSLDILKQDYKNWETKNTLVLKETKEKLKKIEYIQKELNKIHKNGISIITTIPEENSNTYEYAPTLKSNREPVKEEDGIDVFNDTIISPVVPYIKYVSNEGREYIKVHQMSFFDNIGVYKHAMQDVYTTNRKNTMYISVWSGNAEGIEYNKKGFFLHIVYKIAQNKMRIHISEKQKDITQTENDIMKRVLEAFPTLSFEDSKQVHISGDFSMYDKDRRIKSFDTVSFLDFVTNNPIFSNYIYVEEKAKPFALKKRIDVHMISLYNSARIKSGSNKPSVSITIKPEITTVNKKAVFGDSSELAFPPKTYFLQISISQAESEGTLKNFIYIFSTLMEYYFTNNIAVYKKYKDYFPTISIIKTFQTEATKGIESPPSRESYAKQKISSKNIKDLSIIAPDLFVHNYARRCQGSLQPKIISDDEVEKWKKKRIPVRGGKGEYKDRQIMVFPDPNDKAHDERWNFVCPTEENPYPGLKVNNDLSNKDKYPYIICCYKTDNMSPSEKTNKHKKYQDYISNIIPEKSTGHIKTERKINTKKILGPNRTGVLPKNLEDTLSFYKKEKKEMVRLGTPRSKHSLIHCICIATGDPLYKKLTTNDGKEDYVVSIRKQITKHIHMEIMKQECFDKDVEEIKALVSDENVFFDPSLFYRSLEEIYDINIYTFAYADDSATTTTTTDNGTIVIPRHNIYHSRPIRSKRPTILIMRSLGADTDALLYPQCELIVDYNSDSDKMVGIFGKSMTTICHKIISNVGKTITWNIETTINSLEARLNINYHIDYEKIIPYRFIHQHIDNYGKLRAVSFMVEETPVTLFTLPSQPLAVPISPIVYKISYKMVKKIFGTPTAYTLSSTSPTMIQGVWFSALDIENAHFVPIEDQPYSAEKDSLPIIKQKYIVENETNPISYINSLSTMRRIVDINIQLVQWCYSIAKRDDEKLTPEEFIKQYTTMTKKYEAKNSLYFYDLSRLNRHLPDANNIKEAIKTMEFYRTNLFKNGKIVFYDNAYKEKMYNMLVDYDIIYNTHTTDQKTVIDRFYVTEKDFKSQDHVLLFLSGKNMQDWLLSETNRIMFKKILHINDRIYANASDSTDPYFYKTENENYFLVQNVSHTTQGKYLALNIAYIWSEVHVNMADSMNEENAINVSAIPHVVYALNNSMKLIVVEDDTDGNESFLEIMYYGSALEYKNQMSATYAALLPIL